MDDDTSILLFDNPISIYEIDVKDLENQKKVVRRTENVHKRVMRAHMTKKKEDIHTTQVVTEDKLDKRTRDMVKILE